MPEREQLSLFQFSSCRRMVAVAMEATTVAGHAGKGPCRVQGTESPVVVAACWGAATRVEMRVETGGGRSGSEVVAEVVAEVGAEVGAEADADAQAEVGAEAEAEAEAEADAEAAARL